MSRIYPLTIAEDLAAIKDRTDHIEERRILSIVFTVIYEDGDLQRVVSYGRDTRPVDRREEHPLIFEGA